MHVRMRHLETVDMRRCAGALSNDVLVGRYPFGSVVVEREQHAHIEQGDHKRQVAECLGERSKIKLAPNPNAGAEEVQCRRSSRDVRARLAALLALAPRAGPIEEPVEPLLPGAARHFEPVTTPILLLVALGLDEVTYRSYSDADHAHEHELRPVGQLQQVTD